MTMNTWLIGPWSYITVVSWISFVLFFLRCYLFIFREGEGRKRNVSVWLPLTCPQLGTWPTTQACALTGNRTSDLLVHRLALHPMGHTSQGCFIYLFFNVTLVHTQTSTHTPRTRNFIRRGRCWIHTWRYKPGDSLRAHSMEPVGVIYLMSVRYKIRCIFILSKIMYNKYIHMGTNAHMLLKCELDINIKLN